MNEAEATTIAARTTKTTTTTVSTKSTTAQNAVPKGLTII